MNENRENSASEADERRVKDQAISRETSHSRRPLDPNVFGISMIEENTRILGDFLLQYINIPNIEIEAKLGLLIDKSTQERLKLPILNESILVQDGGWYRFESCINLHHFKQLNLLLNERVNDTRNPNYKGSRIYYSRHREIDRFYYVNQRKHRVTVDEQGQVTKSIVKERISDMNIVCPRLGLDFRISVNTEEPVIIETGNMIPEHERRKDRISYSHDLWSFDLTTVAKTERHQPTSYTYEVEIEISQIDTLKREAELLRSQPNTSNYYGLVHRLLQNIRILAKRAGESCSPSR